MRKKIFLFLILAASFFFLVTLEKLYRERNAPSSPTRISKEAEKIIEKCKTFEYKPECYDELIPKLMDSMQMNDVFKVVSHIQKADNSYAYCHVVAHKLSFIEAQRKPDDWIGIMHSCPVDMCDYGCQHGVLVEKFRKEELVGDELENAIALLNDVCEPQTGWDLPFLVKRSCYHGLGHAAMYITGGSLEAALDICANRWTKGRDKAFLKVCMEGVFMTVFQGVDLEDFALVKDIKPEKGEVLRFCGKHKGLVYQSCMRESYPFSHRDFQNSPDKAMKFCSYANSEEMMEDCVAVVSYVRSFDTLEDNSKNFLQNTFDYCDGFSLKSRNWCYKYTAYGLLEVDVDFYFERSIKICEKAIDVGLGSDCFNTLVNFSKLKFHPGSTEAIDYCNRLPSKWREECLALNEKL